MPKLPTKNDAPESNVSVSAESFPKSVSSANVVKKDKPRYVRVQNKLQQVLTLSVVNDDGQAVELRLEPLATSLPLRDDRLTDQVRRLDADGKVRIR